MRRCCRIDDYGETAFVLNFALWSARYRRNRCV